MLSAMLAFALEGAAQAPPPRKPAPPGAEVTLEAQALMLPSLPSSVAEAERSYGSVRKGLEAAFREAEGYLEICSEELGALGQSPSRVTIPAAFVDEARALSPFVFDAKFVNLKGAVLDRWNAWQSVLLRAGMNDPKEDDRMAHRMLILSSTTDEDGEKGFGGFTVAWTDPGATEATALDYPTELRWVEVLAVDRMGYGAHTDFAREALAFADQQMPGLLESWKPLTAHLNAGARDLLDLDRTQTPTRDPGVRALRLVAKINFMKRFRSALWFCQVAWAHMASERILTIQQMREKFGRT